MIRLAILLLIIFYFLLPGNLPAQNQKEGWVKIPSPTTKTLRNLCFLDAQTGWAAGEDGTIIHTSNGGDSWVVQNSTVQTFIVDVFFINETLGWAITFRDTFPFGTIILETTNGGDNWIADDYPDGNAFMNTVFFFDSLNGWIGGTYIAGTTDGGATWDKADVDSSIISSLPVYGFNFYNRQFGYACGGYLDLAGVIWRTTDYGENWSATGVSPDQVFDLYILDSLNTIGLSGDPEGFFGTGNISTTDAGANWTYDEMTLSGLSFTIDFRTETEGWSASGYKFLITSDSGDTWEDKETPDSAIIFDLTFIDSRNGFAVGENGAILKYIPGPVGVNEINNDVVPADIVLYQNYPNPFNPETKIRFTIPQYEQRETQEVSLKVYDVLGNEIITLVNEEKPAGEYEVIFNTDLVNQNSELPGGVYFYQLRAGRLVQTKKMVYLK
ncbi:MAG: T9SS type A sorting domain-containing protein [Ignavibacteriaceae bacterium]|nr:T9SS type A sorting domain-containing protein [Ignavibacteriaceae bacterium]